MPYYARVNVGGYAPATVEESKTYASARSAQRWADLNYPAERYQVGIWRLNGKDEEQTHYRTPGKWVNLNEEEKRDG